MLPRGFIIDLYKRVSRIQNGITSVDILQVGLQKFLTYQFSLYSTPLASLWVESETDQIKQTSKTPPFLSTQGFPGGSEVKAPACNVGDLGSIPGWGRSPGEGNGNPLQYSCLENPLDGGAWWATVHWATKSRTRLSDFTFFHFHLPI